MKNNLVITANQLALKFSDELEIPSRLKKKENEKKERQKSNLNSLTEQRFQKNVTSWLKVIETLLSKVESKNAWRYITITPEIESNIKSAAYCKDFIEFTDYFVLRRDIENCDDEEVGLISMLHSEFQKEIEKKIEKAAQNNTVKSDELDAI
ncbi:MAG: hypothetical protein H0V01_02580 [Bacteroidetes bacterium]|nr:hypothetical protein [Bacteroidota bacterium]HET6243857.1 hypothetical protein [Bacteroidia bacterium]